MVQGSGSRSPPGLSCFPGRIGYKMQNAIEGLLAVSILKLVLDFISSMGTAKKMDHLRNEFQKLQISLAEVCTIIKERIK